MNRPFVLRPRRRPRVRRLALATAAAPAASLPADAPRLTMAEPEDTRVAWISSAVSVAVHAVALAIVFWVGLRAADEVAEEIIPVRILEPEPIELPGTVEPAAPAPRQLAPRQRVSAADLAPRAAVDMAAPQAVERARVDTRTLELDELREAPAPAEVTRRRLDSERVTALDAAPRAPEARVDLAPTPRVLDADTTPLRAPAVEVGGPRVVEAPRPAIAPSAAFSERDGVSARRYEGRTGPLPEAAGLSDEGRYGAIDIDPSVAQDFAVPGGSDSPDLPGAPVGVPCEESAFVQRYYLDVERRTRAQWQVPDGTRPGDRALLRVYIDTNGSARNIELLESATQALGESAVVALQRASPFSPLDVNTRCLADLSMKITLTYGVD